jgi:hypothetical protein
MKLTTYLYLLVALRLRMCGVISPLSHIFMTLCLIKYAWCHTGACRRVSSLSKLGRWYSVQCWMHLNLQRLTRSDLSYCAGWFTTTRSGRASPTAFLFWRRRLLLPHGDGALALISTQLLRRNPRAIEYTNYAYKLSSETERPVEVISAFASFRYRYLARRPTVLT